MGFKVIDADFGELKEPIGKFEFAYADLPEKGYIGFQNHGRELWFRNVRMKVGEVSHCPIVENRFRPVQNSSMEQRNVSSAPLNSPTPRFRVIVIK